MPGRTQAHVETRFWAKVALPNMDGCMLWTACLTPLGYGRFAITEKRLIGAHRLAYQLLVGPTPDGLVLDHLCRVPACVAPDHLELVTQRVNVLRGEGTPARNAVKTHCDSGHEYTEANTHVDARGWRECRACSRARGRRAYNKKREAIA